MSAAKTAVGTRRPRALSRRATKRSGDEAFEQRLRDRRRCGALPRWPVALAGGREEGELADRQNLAADVADAAVHQSGGIGEDAQAGQFARHPVEVAVAVALLEAGEDEQTGSDGADGFAGDVDTCRADPLYDHPHAAPLLVSVRRMQTADAGHRSRNSLHSASSGGTWRRSKG